MMLSIVVNAYTRARFLRSCLESIARQSPADKIEVLVITALPDLTIPTHIGSIAKERGLDIRIVMSPPGPVGLGVVSALQFVKGDFVSFLDDDDSFDPRKIKFILEMIQGTPDLGYIHNAQHFVDEKGNPLSWFNPHRLVRHPASLLRESQTLNVDPNDPDSIRKGAQFEPGFNNSSITIRKSILVANQSYLSRVRRGEDTFLYYLALSSRLPMLLTSDRLTCYRIHTSAATRSTYGNFAIQRNAEAYRDFAKGHIDSCRLIEECIHDEAIPYVLQDLMKERAFWEVLEASVAGTFHPSRFRTQVRELLDSDNGRPRGRDVLTSMIGGVATFFPRLTSIGFQMWRTWW